MLDWIDRLDKAASEAYFLNLHNPNLEAVAAIFSNEYLHLLWFIPLTFWIFKKNTPVDGVIWLTSLGLAVILASFIIDLGKNWAARPRPETWLGIALEMPPTAWPSAHSGNSYAIATATLLFARKPAMIAFFFALATALSRFFLLKHYPSDIVSGALIGVAAALLAYPAGEHLVYFVRARLGPADGAQAASDKDSPQQLNRSDR